MCCLLPSEFRLKAQNTRRLNCRIDPGSLLYSNISHPIYSQIGSVVVGSKHTHIHADSHQYLELEVFYCNIICNIVSDGSVNAEFHIKCLLSTHLYNY